jgi:chloramphenicol 3-O-phosphotransferase
VGKTAVGWEIISRLTQTGTASGYVDIDQLGICYPEPATDPGRHRMKARNLAAVVANFRESGARCVIVSGVVDPGHGVPADQFPNTALTICRLRAGRAELTRRFTGRNGPPDLVDSDLVAAVLREADALDASDFADLSVDTSGLPVTEVARLVRERAGGWPTVTGSHGPYGSSGPYGSAGPNPASEAAEPGGRTVPGADGTVLWLCGTTGVGKSSVGFAVYQRILHAGHTAAYVDLDQLGFRAPAPPDDPAGHHLKARNLAALWQTYRAADAEYLVVTGPVENEAAVKTYTDKLRAAALTLCRLHAGPEHLTDRILRRGQGGTWSQPGDPLKGQLPARLRQIATQAAAHAEALERTALGDLRIDTGSRTVEEVADAIVTNTGWTATTRPQHS